MARTSYEIKLVGLPQLLRKLRFEETMQAPYREALVAGADAMLRTIRGEAPHGETGQLEAKLTKKVAAQPIPRWAIVKTTATRSSAHYRRYSYPRRLAFDRHSPHKDWMLKGRNAALPTLFVLLSKVANQIEQRWRRSL